MTKIDFDKIVDIARGAGEAIMDVYLDDEASKLVETKDDDSPLTLADKASHNFIVSELEKHGGGLPVLSEEASSIDFNTRRQWTEYWLVDPLDGTKEFINRNGEFTVNIALIKDCIPVFGVVYVPVTGVLYYGSSDTGAYKVTAEEKQTISVSNRADKLIAVRSRSHASADEEELFAQYDVVDTISVGSSLKFCMVAEGKADIYYRHGPTMEWDTAAGHAVVRSAGGEVYIGSSKIEPFTYNKENLLNGSFLVTGF